MRSFLTSYCASSRHETRPRLRQLGGVHCVPTAVPTSKKPLHSRDELFAKHIEPEPALEDPFDWTMEEASDDEDDAPMPDALPELEIVDMPPAPASARPMSNLEPCIALRIVATRRSHRPSQKKAFASNHIVPLLSHVSVVPCVVTQGDFCAVP